MSVAEREGREKASITRQVQLPTTDYDSDLGYDSDEEGEGCGTTCQRITEALLRANSGGKRKTKNRLIS